MTEPAGIPAGEGEDGDGEERLIAGSFFPAEKEFPDAPPTASFFFAFEDFEGLGAGSLVLTEGVFFLEKIFIIFFVLLCWRNATQEGAILKKC